MKSFKLFPVLLFLTACGSGIPKYDATGTFEATDVIVSAEATGKILTLDVEEGTTLRAGQEIGVIDTNEAGKLFRFHALWEVFLVEKLHFSWSEAHEQADGLEHQTSDMLAERLDEFLGHPEHCPHGDPIPKADGSRKGLTFRTLSDLKEGDSTTIRRIVEDYSLMDYLQEKGIHPDMRVTVKEKEPYEGPILLATEAGDISLSYKAVEQIFVDE